MIVRYVRPLTESQRHTLAAIMKHDAIPRARVRADGILLSSQGMKIKEIAKAYQVDTDTVATWIKKWEQRGIASLYDKPLSISSLKRLAKKAGLRWKRVRKSLKSLREPAEFPKCQRELEALQKQEDQGKIDLYYCDESGFTLDPYIPYAWQEPGTVIELPATKGTRINLLGLMNRKNDLHPYMFEQSINTAVVVACLNDVCTNITKKTIVVMDNSSIHRSEEFEEYIPLWKKKGLMIKYLIPYAPELNLIEILWRHIKYFWLPFSAYQCMEALREALEQILKDFRSKYQITFA